MYLFTRKIYYILLCICLFKDETQTTVKAQIIQKILKFGVGVLPMCYLKKLSIFSYNAT